MKITYRSAILGLVWVSPVLCAAGPEDALRDLFRRRSAVVAGIVGRQSERH